MFMYVYVLYSYMLLHIPTYIVNVLCFTIKHEKNLQNYLRMDIELQSKVFKL
jgi:hypothetical protein